MYKTLICSLILSNISAAIPALAQDTIFQSEIEEIEVFSVSRRSQGLDDVNAAVSILSADELSLVAQTHYQESLNRLPDVNIHRNNGQESLVAIRSPVLTGAGACGSFLIAENGIPLRSNGFCNVNEMFDAHTENAEQIEVVRGPSSAFWGANAVHSMINVLLPSPGEAGRLRLEAGPRGSYRVQGQVGEGEGDFKQSLLVTGVSEDGYLEYSR